MLKKKTPILIFNKRVIILAAQRTLCSHCGGVCRHKENVVPVVRGWVVSSTFLSFLSVFENVCPKECA